MKNQMPHCLCLKKVDSPSVPSVPCVPCVPCVHSVLHVHPGPSYPFLSLPIPSYPLLFLNQVD